MGLADRDYYRDRHRPKNRPKKPAPRPRSGRLAQVLVWIVVLLAGTAGAKWVMESRQDLPFPQTGQVFWYVDPASGPTAPLAVHAPVGGDASFLVQLDQWETKTPVAMVPVRAGEVAKLQMPLGRYRVTLIKGTGWQGPGKLFRRTISSRETVHPLEFFRVGGRTTGHIIQLETLNGNLETAPAWL